MLDPDLVTSLEGATQLRRTAGRASPTTPREVEDTEFTGISTDAGRKGQHSRTRQGSADGEVRKAVACGEGTINSEDGVLSENLPRAGRLCPGEQLG